MEIKSITVIRTDYQSDTVLVNTDLPSPVWPFTDTHYFKFHAAKGEDYCKEHFPGVPINVVDTRIKS